MELVTAIQLIKNGVHQNDQRQVWADLGAGNGLFTQALSTLLFASSKIYAIDKKNSAPFKINMEVELVSMQMDFSKEWKTELLDGIILANAFHFIEDKSTLLNRLIQKLKPYGRIIIVEYDIEEGNVWVPYPINFETLTKLATDLAFQKIERLADTPSLYHRGIYSAVLRL
jgi:Trans-aconitate methyltransferase